MPSPVRDLGMLIDLPSGTVSTYKAVLCVTADTTFRADQQANLKVEQGKNVKTTISVHHNGGESVQGERISGLLRIRWMTSSGF